MKAGLLQKLFSNLGINHFFKLFSSNQFLFFSAGYFCINFLYSIIRSTTTSFFIEAYGAKQTPSGWFLSILCLLFAVTFINRLQSKWEFKKVYLFITGLVTLGFVSFGFAYSFHSPWAAMGLYVLKEVYIILFIHLYLGYLNSSLQESSFKSWIGWVGFAGSGGGILGGFVTNYAGSAIGSFWLFSSAIVALCVSSFLVLGLDDLNLRPKDSQNGKFNYKKSVDSPLQTLKESSVLEFTVSLCFMLFASQILINTTEFQFNLNLEKNFSSIDARTAHQGLVYIWVNIVSLLLSVIVVPYVFSHFQKIPVHYTLWILVSSLALLTNLFGVVTILGPFTSFISVCFIVMKGNDYSFFSAAKEWLYQPLSAQEKFGVKYITDMIVYRASKALIALGLIFFQDPLSLFLINLCALTLWFLGIRGLKHFAKREVHVTSTQ
jgi:AAA family ATP:ADP antiporter